MTWAEWGARDMSVSTSENALPMGRVCLLDCDLGAPHRHEPDGFIIRAHRCSDGAHWIAASRQVLELLTPEEAGAVAYYYAADEQKAKARGQTSTDQETV